MRRYKDKRWERKRFVVLKRDEYQCRECKRYGKTVAANTVHHVYPAEDYPQWWLATWNLLSLCAACHGKMHDKTSDKLTELGLEWMERTIPPTFELGK